MDVLLELLSITNIVLCLAIVALVWMQRKLTEILVLKLFKKDLNSYKIWTDFFVPVGPLGTGAILMLIPGVPVMAMFTATLGAKVVFGLGLGLVSGLVYRLAKKNVLDKLGKTDDSEDDSEDYSK